MTATILVGRILVHVEKDFKMENEKTYFDKNLTKSEVETEIITKLYNELKKDQEFF